MNNIPLDACAERGIVVFNTPGANANGVKELVIAGLILSSRDIAGGIEWCKKEKENPNIAKDVEKAKKAFAGHEIKGKKLGVTALGLLAPRLPMRRLHLEWRFTDTIRLFPSMLPGCFPEM